MKLGEIGEEMVATAIRLAEESGASSRSLYVIPRPARPAARRRARRAGRAGRRVARRGAKLLGGRARRRGRGRASCARASIGAAIVGEAASGRPTSIVLGSAPRWRRQSRFFSPDGRVRAAPGAVRGADRRVPAGRARGGGSRSSYARDEVLVIGCGRVGSSVARSSPREGWDVTVVDEKRGGARAGSATTGAAASSSATGWTRACCAGRDRGRRRRRRRRRTATTRTSSSRQVAQRRVRGAECVVVRILDPARAKFYARAGHADVVCPTQTAIEALTDGVLTPARPPRGGPAPDVRARRRRRQGRLERRCARCSGSATRRR